MLQSPFPGYALTEGAHLAHKLNYKQALQRQHLPLQDQDRNLPGLKLALLGEKTVSRRGRSSWRAVSVRNVSTPRGVELRWDNLCLFV